MRDAAEIYLGRIERDMSWSDINATNTTVTQVVNAANAVFDRALEHLRRHSAVNLATVPRFYSLSVAKASRPLWPGHTVRVVYRRVVDGYVAANIDADLWILESTIQIDSSGIRTVALQVASVDRWPAGDAAAVVNEMQQSNVSRAHTVPQSGKNTSAMGIPVYVAVEDGRITEVYRERGAPDNRYKIGTSEGGGEAYITLRNGVIVSVETTIP
jgi:hypothetical protein